ncbi:MAG: hypothetical protein R3E18_06250 [Sphingomonadaceae bacterium]
MNSSSRNFSSADAGYFFEEVRRQLIGEFGETAEDSPNSVYAGGLWVRTSLDPELQDVARDALVHRLPRWYRWRPAGAALLATIDPAKGDMKS